MAERKVKIATIKSNDKFFNITDAAGTEYGIGKEKSPVLAGILANAKEGDEVTGDYWEKNGKHYLFDLKTDDKKGGGGGKSFAPKDKSFDAAVQIAAGAAKSLVTQSDDQKTLENKLNMIHAWVMGKVSK